MTNKQKLFGVGLVIVGFAVGFLVAGSFGAKMFGGVYSTSEKNFGQGITVGVGEEFAVSSAGVLSSSAAAVWSAAQSFTSTFTVGSSGTALTRINAGTCYIAPLATTIAASSTATVECQGTAAIKVPMGTAGGVFSALTGVSSGDIVQVQLSTTTAAGGTASAQNSGLVVIGATASSTQGYIQLLIANHTGTTFTWPVTGSASGTAAYIVMD